MKYSILIPSYDPDARNTKQFMELLESIEKHSAGKDYEIIIRKNGPSYCQSHNDALMTSQGDYIIILNDDVKIKDPEWLEKLTDDYSIISWKEGVFGHTGEPCWDFACWGMSRKIFNKIGYFDERFKDGIGFEDNDYHYRAKELGIPFEARDIDIIHYGGGALNTYFGGHNIQRERNHSLFMQKWLV